jgi:hypothetical protein
VPAGERADEDSLGMNMYLFGPRQTLILNLCALVMACVAVTEGEYIVHGARGYYLPQDAWVYFVPALVMFIVRNGIFSCCFLAIYILNSIQMFFDVRSIFLGTYVDTSYKYDPPISGLFFFLFSIVSLMVYAVIAFARFVFKIINSARAGHDTPS